jgi:hypothetical protein
VVKHVETNDEYVFFADSEFPLHVRSYETSLGPRGYILPKDYFLARRVVELVFESDMLEGSRMFFPDGGLQLYERHVTPNIFRLRASSRRFDIEPLAQRAHLTVNQQALLAVYETFDAQLSQSWRLMQRLPIDLSVVRKAADFDQMIAAILAESREEGSLGSMKRLREDLPRAESPDDPPEAASPLDGSD